MGVLRDEGGDIGLAADTKAIRRAQTDEQVGEQNRRATCAFAAGVDTARDAGFLAREC
jgi:hypothetical protein